ncbi:zinc-binding dehydrogenase [Limnoglobus roseus]|uniref:alcohol dehydrogenase n=1 Tax=Limnoglobus roseus TaxID=2598579 RepID=A0A5C1A6A1_9BACT|nr:zinc-binding dehydrogenase [Limnoglobus roseus]QEL14681.1 alcohol dehydrogenase, zinc-containing [Limnoglobus roseus]
MTPRAMLFTGAGQPLQSLPQSTVPPTGAEVRVRMLCCTLCRSDLATYTGQRIEPTPTILGHEVVGEIESFGPAANRSDATGQVASIGDRITWAIVAACGSCFYCERDLPQKCERGVKYGHHRTSPDHPNGGGLADAITLVPGTEWFRVPDNLSTPVASLANCAGATVAAVLEAAGPVAGQTVLIYGAGLLGLLACAMIAAHGARAVIAVDPDRGSRERAIAFGATHTLDPNDPAFDSDLREIVGPRGGDVALELAGRAETVGACLGRVRTGGVVVLAGTVSPTPAVSLDPQQFVRRMLTLRGIHNYQSRHLRAALDFLAGPGKVYPLESLIAETFPLDRVVDAFSAAQHHTGRRVAVTSSSPPEVPGPSRDSL